MRKVQGSEARRYGRQVINVFDSWTDYVEYGEKGPSATNEAAGYNLSRTKSNGGNDWDLGLGYKGSVKLAKEGWSEVRSEIEGIASEVKSQMQGVEIDTFAPTFARTGSSVNVGRMLSGVDKCMIRQQLTPQATNTAVVSIVVELGVSGSLKSHVILKRGAAILALLDVLRHMQVAAEVWITNDDCRVALDVVPLVKAGQSIDIDELAFALAHPCGLRRIGFASQEANDEQVCGGYGQVAKEPTEWIRENVNPTVAINGTRTSVGNAGDVVNRPVEWIKAQLSGAGLIGDNGWASE